MVSSMLCLRKLQHERCCHKILLVRYVLGTLLLIVLTMLSALAHGNDAQVVAISPKIADEQLSLDADLELDLTGELHKAANKGIPIYFTANVELVRPRWWWFDKVITKKQMTWRVVYNALTRQWRVGSQDVSVPETSLEDALTQIRYIRNWQLMDITALKEGERYEGRLRLRLDTSLFAKPIQIDALNSSAWSLSTPWKSFSFTYSDGKLVP